GATGGQPPRNPYAGGATGGQPPRNPYAGGATGGGQPPRNPYAGGATEETRRGILKNNLQNDKTKKHKKVHFACTDKDFEDLEKQKQRNKQESKDMFLASLTQLSDIACETGVPVSEEEILRHNGLGKSITQKKEDLRDIYDTVFGNQSYPPPIEVDTTPYIKYPLKDREALLDKANLRLTGSRDHYRQQMDVMLFSIMESGISQDQALDILLEDPDYFKLNTAYDSCVIELAELPDK
ncbi:MAG: hypothetical protein KFW09_05390, partial [Oscillospiraceae bacterium]|nr:hypothetical protein [Oscillospiraceae bacterium]